MGELGEGGVVLPEPLRLLPEEPVVKAAAAADTVALALRIASSSAISSSSFIIVRLIQQPAWSACKIR
jgi:hypothetical protein